MKKLILGLLIVVLALAVGYIILQEKSVPAVHQIVNNLPTTCTDASPGDEAVPVITSLSIYSGSVGTSVEIRGCNFAGFEGDKNAWIMNSQGTEGILYGEEGSTSKLIKLTLKSPICQKDNSYSGLICTAPLDLTSGQYKIYVRPWDKKSNLVNFEIK